MLPLDLFRIRNFWTGNIATLFVYAALSLNGFVVTVYLQQEAGFSATLAGLASLPGGGAEIFDPEVRKRIAGQKSPAHRWLEIHETAHRLGIQSNATMLCGHVEEHSHRVDHMERLRDLQAAIKRHEVRLSDGRSISLAVSIGAAVFPRDGDSSEALLAAADARMYQDKSRWRDDREPRPDDDFPAGLPRPPIHKM